MTKDTYRRRRKRESLYLKLILYILFGVLIAGTVYVGLRLVFGHYIESYYSSEELESERRAKYILDLEKYAEAEKVSSTEVDKIDRWTAENPYYFLLIYRNDELIYSPARGEGQTNSKSNEDGYGSEHSDYGSIISFGINNEVSMTELRSQAEKGGRHPIRFLDGTVFVAVADYSEELYYDVTNLVSLIMAILMLSVSLGFGFRHILIRIKRLESDVNIVSHINMNHQIVCEGEDEIGFLSRNVENMRITILENLEKERDARDANTELITAMSHDIRTPLTVLLGYIDMLKNYDGCDETVRSYVAATERTAQRLKELSDDMFKYSLAFTDPERETEITEYEAKMLFDQLLSEHVLLLSESGYTVNMGNELSLIDDNATVYTDPQNLMRVIDNIFQNIYKYADKEKPVDISIKCDRKEITFCFRNGIQRDPTEAESNRIGLKTCERLCRFIASEFSYENDGEYFTVKLRLSFGKPNKNRIKIDKE